MTGPPGPRHATGREVVAGVAGPGPSADHASSRGTWIAVLAVALIARLVFVIVVPRVIVWADAREYDELARWLVDRGTYGPQALRAPGYPTLMAAVYLIFGKSLLALRLVEAVLGTVAVGIVGAIGSRLFGRRAGLIAAALMALHPVLAFLPSTQYSENTVVLAIALALGAAFEAWRKDSWWRWAAAGVFLGAATLVRPNAILVWPGLAFGFMVALLHQRRGWFLPLLVTSLALVLTILPWTLRNHQVHGRWFFVATGGGRSLWLGNNPWTECVTWASVQPDSATQADIRRMPDGFALDRYYQLKGVEFIREHPAQAARLYWVKLGNLFALYPEPYTRNFMSAWVRWAQGLASVTIYIGALLAFRRWRAEPALWPLTASIVTFSLVNALYYSVLRYRMVVEPCLLLMAGLGWASIWEQRPWQRRFSHSGTGSPGEGRGTPNDRRLPSMHVTR
jgi:4-amino-4-deoxy-L-arabinose transferase-like glycosyltransferase